MERSTPGAKVISSPQTDDFSQTIRSMIDSENTLVNHRVGWLTTLQGLLFAALGFAWDKPTAASLVPIFCVLGIGTAFIVSLALIGATRAQVQLMAWWDQHKPTHYAGPDVVGLRPPPNLSHFLAPWTWLAALFVVAWFAVAGVRLSANFAPAHKIASTLPTQSKTPNR